MQLARSGSCPGLVEELNSVLPVMSRLRQNAARSFAPLADFQHNHPDHATSGLSDSREHSPTQRSWSTFERANDVISDPAAIKVTVLRFYLFPVDITAVGFVGVEGEVVPDGREFF